MPPLALFEHLPETVYRSLVSAKQEVEPEDDRCPVCGQLWTEPDQPSWFFVEVTRYSSDGRPGWTSEGFCSQAHAAQWLAASLPPFEPVTYNPRTARDRLEDLGLMALFGVPAVLTCVGIFAIFNWLGPYR